MKLKEMRNIRYPFSKSLVIFSVILVVFSMYFAIVMLKNEKSISINVGATTVFIHPLVLYFAATLLITYISVLIKARLYAPAKTEIVDKTSGSVEEIIKSFKRLLTLIYVLIIAIMIVVPLLAIWGSGLLWFIGVTSFISGINLSEVIIYTFSKRT